MFRYGIPEFRLPKAALEGEIEVIRRLGARFQMSTRLGEDVGLEDLRHKYDAVFLALGAELEEEPGFEGAQAALSALEFLRRVREGNAPGVGSTVVVIGGGNEAVASARSALRLGATSVTILWQDSRRSMPCFNELVEAAEAEGVKLELEAAPVQLERSDGGRLRLRCKGAGGGFSLDASCIIRAPVRGVDTGLAEGLGVKVSTRGIAVDRQTLATNLEGVFAAGEAVSGAGPGVRAVASGRLGALSIHRYLSRREVTGETEPVNVRMGKLDEGEQAALFRGIEKHPRVRLRTIEMARRRAGFAEVEQGLSESEAKAEAARCLSCDCLARDDCRLRALASEYGARVGRFKGARRRFERDESHPEVLYEPGKCILCGLCVRITEEQLEKLGMSFTRRGFVTEVRAALGALLAQGLTRTARRCAEACPTGALALKRKQKVTK
jgi:NADPH-dependent glutamate synthase beta subunit-like oxidoreductase